MKNTETIQENPEKNQKKACFRFDWTNCKLLKTIFIVAGVFILLFTFLAFYVIPLFIIFVLLVGIMQIIFGITGFCPMAIMLKKIGLKCNIKK